MLTSLTKSSTAWVFENVSNFSFQNNWKSCKIGTNTYGISEEIVVISQEEQIEPQELIEGDVVTVYGIDKTIVSIILENGHGYLRLENGDYFVDGWIEVGQEMIYPITEDMLLTVPEGKHQILVSKNGTVGIKEATIERNQETKQDD